MIIDGKAIAEEVLHALAIERAAFSKQPILGILLSGGDAAAESFVRIKTRVAERLGVRIVSVVLPQDTMTAPAVAAVERLGRECDGVLVQLPLPETLDTQQILSAIPPTSDVDALNPSVLEVKRPARAPVAGAVAEILAQTGTQARGKRAVIVGEGRLVGIPCAELLRALGAKVSVISKTNGSLTELMRADIIVSGAGVPGLIQPDMIKEGVVLIDAGTSEQGGKLAGDADPACAARCTVFTPVPGGVGPIAVAMIFKNLFELIRQKEPGFQRLS